MKKKKLMIFIDYFKHKLNPKVPNENSKTYRSYGKLYTQNIFPKNVHLFLFLSLLSLTQETRNVEKKSFLK